MAPNEDEVRIELEQLIVAARPKLDAGAQEQLIYTAGRAAGFQDAEHGRIGPRKRNVWLSLSSHLACSLVAGWLALAVVPRFKTQPSDLTVVIGETLPADAKRSDSVTTEKFLIQNKQLELADEVLNPRMAPEKFVRLLSTDASEVVSGATRAEDEPVLHSRSIMF